MTINLTAKKIGLVNLNHGQRNSMDHYLGIRFTGMGRDWLAAEMPFSERTRQPFGLLHGGASVVLIESLASTAAFLCVHEDGRRVAGVEVNANHLRQVKSGMVRGITRPLYVGRRLHVWSVDLFRDDGKTSTTGRLTVAVLPPAG